MIFRKQNRMRKVVSFLRFRILLCFLIGSSCVSIQKQKKKADLYHQKALTLIQKCQYPLALAQLKKSLKSDTKKPIYHHSIALLYFQFKKYEKATHHLKLALKLKPDFTGARVHLGRSLIEAGQHKKGLKELEKAKEDLTYPYKEKIHVHQGMAHFKKKAYALAEKHFNVARTVYKKDCVTALYHAQSFYFLEQYRKALSLLEPAKNWCQKEKPLCSEPSFDVYFFSALAYNKIGQRTKALQDINTFLSQSKKSKHLKQARQYQKLWTL